MKVTDNSRARAIDLQEREIPDGFTLEDLLEDVCILEYKPEDLVESEDPSKGPTLTGRLGWVDKPTANKRNYPRRVMVGQIGKLSEDMAAGGVYGQLDHPKDGRTSMQKVSHLVREAKVLSDGEIIGKFELIPGTVCGDQAIAIARAGGRLGVSQRGFGTTVTDGNGNHNVQEDYNLTTWDIVGDPANAGAHPKFTEDKEINDMMDLERLKKEHPELVEELETELKKELEVEARDHARVSLKAEFEDRLKEEGKTIREEAQDQAREELLKDPKVAGSATVMEEIKRLVLPFVLDEDENLEVARLRQEVQKLQEKIKEQDEQILEAAKDNQELQDVAKEFGYHLYLERELDDDRREQVVEMLGDVTVFNELDDLKSRVEEIVEALNKSEEPVQEFVQKIEDLEGKLVKMEEERDAALRIGKKFGVKAYLERQLSEDPRATDMREYVEGSKPESKEEVDRLLEGYRKENPLSDEFKRIKQGLSRTARRPDEDVGDGSEYGDERNLQEANDDIQEDVFGVDINELAERAGIPQGEQLEE